MRQSTKFSLSDLPTISSEIIEGKNKSVTYNDVVYDYRIDKYSMFKDYVAITVKGPRGLSAMTTCKMSSVKKELKKLILLLQHR